jgi:uncharacterized protein
MHLPRPEPSVRKIVIVALLAAAVAGAGIEHHVHEAARHTATTAVAGPEAAFRPAPIRPEWILAGDPVTEIAAVARTHDEAAQVYLWRTTAATFRWIHEADEIVTILAGEVFVTGVDGARHHLKVGDVALFPAGAAQVWEVPAGLLKSAILKPRMPGPFAAVQRWLRRARGLIAA